MKTLKLKLNGEGIFITYSPDSANTKWIRTKIELNETFVCKKVFHLRKNDFSFDSEDCPASIDFKIADMVELDNEKYYFLNKRIFEISFNFYIETSCHVTLNWFIGTRNISILKLLEKIGLSDDFFIGGKRPNAILEKEYQQAIKSLPTSTELDKYVKVRIYREFANLICIKKDSESEFQKYLLRKSLKSSGLNEENYRDFDTERYKVLLLKLKHMLDNPGIYETVWEKEILKFIQIIYPKYVFCRNQVEIKSSYNTNKRLDILLADSSGNIDICEIKRPHENSLLTRSSYDHDNYVPLRELSGTVMQCEKYIYFLSRNAEIIEKELNKKYESSFPNGYSLKIVNPKALLIIGKSVLQEQKFDFEIIRRKYKSVIDIITYDDLINRFETAIKFFEFNSHY